MGKRKVEIEVDENGIAHVDMEGFKGTECMDIGKKLEEIFGETVSIEKKPEFFQTGKVLDRQKVGGR